MCGLHKPAHYEFEQLQISKTKSREKNVSNDVTLTNLGQRGILFTSRVQFKKEIDCHDKENALCVYVSEREKGERKRDGAPC